ncbi:hypothetical protein BpHYR1_030735 [Brachionus plicatilis]|uniref:Uncharacterized protein n=1 Tax=Brachionus plicatilis TaxID=10195 RepID=A0A3M7RI25_BRAPC|nr:hypothetical protein BpHYR1_030735 [Brachionus plicatilis]
MPPSSEKIEQIYCPTSSQNVQRCAQFLKSKLTLYGKKKQEDASTIFEYRSILARSLNLELFFQTSRRHCEFWYKNQKQNIENAKA